MSTFVCTVCHLEYRFDPKFTDEQRRAEYCTECYAEVIEWARKRGLLP